MPETENDAPDRWMDWEWPSPRVTPSAPEVWECGPHANAWNGHDARCRRVISPGSTEGGDLDA